MRSITLSINVSEVTVEDTRISGTGHFGNDNTPIQFTASKFLENIITAQVTIVAIGILTSSVSEDGVTTLSLRISQAGIIPAGTILNSISIVGRLGNNPEVFALKSNDDVARFPLYVKTGKESSNTYAISAFGKTGEILKSYARKGQEVCLTGRIKLSRWSDKETGVLRSKLELIADGVTLISSK